MRIACTIAEREGSIAADQIKVVDKTRVGSKIGKLSVAEISDIKEVMKKMLID